MNAKKKDWGFPNIIEVFIVMLFGVMFHSLKFDVVSMIYFSGFLTVFALPFGIIMFQDREKMKQIRELVRILEGEE